MGNNIYLTGFMGTGKTTVGRLLAKELNMNFVDTDEFIEQGMGMTVPSIFGIYGEAFFRQLEHNALISIAYRQGVVVSTGGGIVLRDDNINIMRRSGVMICLDASPDTVMRNVGSGKGRPVLDGGDLRRNIIELMDKRRQFYCQADIIVNIDDKTPETISDEIIALLKQRGFFA
ncbi:shikimate kinase [Mahella australiensis]|uniref:Shikimate kinase n=1 Tax=Mahella australiensis (strain DSM 15567 / CIP 107919 / 50-1 BON) TaxID=697281 RepID=F4A394_MAHA5|nr:shikimate kinase [Mahella australiensis]AEE96327.1 Shikimate kinase [Mahella australiensis 50-1 BON]